MEIKDIISSGLLELYAMGMTSAEESTQVEYWVENIPEVAAELDKIQDGIEQYANVHALNPSEGLKEKIMSQIFTNSDLSYAADKNVLRAVESSASESRGSVHSMNNYFKWAAAASIILLIGSLVLTYTYYSKYKAIDDQLAQSQQALNNEREMAKTLDQQMGIISDRSAVPVALNGTPHAPQASAKIFWKKDTGGEVFVAPDALPQAPTGMQYQLWAIIDGKPVDAGMIANETGGKYHLQKMKSLGNVPVQAFAITLEKQGGSPAPTMGEMYVISKI